MYSNYNTSSRKNRRRKQRKNTQRFARPKTDSRYDSHIASPQWAEFRKKIIAERGPQCERCHSKDGPLHVHHIHYRNFTSEKPEDVELLCEDCHMQHHFGTREPRRAMFMQWFARSLKYENYLAHFGKG